MRIKFPLPHINSRNPLWYKATGLELAGHFTTLKRVKVATLTGTQASVTKKGLITVDRSRPIIVVRIGKKNYVRDGHHRVTRAWWHAQKTIRAYVLTVEAL